MNYKRILLFFMSSIFCFSVFFSFEQRAEAFSPQVIQHGAVGDDVIELQARLKYIGFYSGKIDGVFGWSTYWALRNFQYEFGMPIDGMAGQQTKDKLVKATKYDEQKTKAEMYGQKGGQAGGAGGGQQQQPQQQQQTEPP